MKTARQVNQEAGVGDVEAETNRQIDNEMRHWVMPGSLIDRILGADFEMLLDLFQMKLRRFGYIYEIHRDPNNDSGEIKWRKK